MNYILEIKAFYDWLEVNQLPTSAIVLWHALMHIANKTGWKDNFTVAVVVLEIKTGLKKQAVYNARTILQNKGLISFQSRGGNQAASYSMYSLVDGSASFKRTQEDTQGDTQGDTQEHTQGHAQGDTINKQNKTKQNKTEKREVETDGNSRPTPSFPTDSFAYQASAYLRDNILSRIPNARVPKSEQDLQKWALHIDQMKRLDNMPEATIKNLIKFATTDTFWQANILSTAKLREKKDTLYAHMLQAQKAKQSKQHENGAQFQGLPKGAKGIYEFLQNERMRGE